MDLISRQISLGSDRTKKLMKTLTTELLKSVWFIFLLVSIPWAMVWIPLLLLSIVTAKLFRPDLGIIARGLSLAFMATPPEENYTNLVHLLVLDGDMSATEFRALFNERVMQCQNPNGDLVFPRFRDTWAEHMFHTFWKPENNFSINYHIRNYDYDGKIKLPSGCSISDIQSVLGDLVGIPWQPEISPWEILVVRDYKVSEKKFGTLIIFRHSHALIDGYGLVSLIRALTRSKYELPLPSFPNVPVWKKCIEAIKVPYYMGPDTLDAAGDSDWVTKTGSSSRPNLIACLTETIPVNTVKAIKNKLGVSYAAVIFGAIGGALERVMTEKNMLVVPHVIDGLNAIPIPGHPGGTVNHAISLRMAMTIKCKSPIQRLRSIDENIRAAKQSLVPIHLSTELKSYFLLLLPTPLRRWVINLAVRPGCTVSSIFPVTDQEIKLEGRKLVELSSIMGAFANSAFSILVTGLSGKQRIILAVDEKKVHLKNDFLKLANLIEEEIQKLRDSID